MYKFTRLDNRLGKISSCIIYEYISYFTANVSNCQNTCRLLQVNNDLHFKFCLYSYIEISSDIIFGENISAPSSRIKFVLLFFFYLSCETQIFTSDSQQDANELIKYFSTLKKKIEKSHNSDVYTTTTALFVESLF